jgi:SAM-dependent methyltransferase
MDPEEVARRLAGESLASGSATGWFERIYVAAERGETAVPWGRGAPHPLLVEWAEARGLRGRGRRALVVGCGLGDDAEYVAGCGFATTAFDVSPTAVRSARHRFPHSPVTYLTADLLAPPADWSGTFDLVVEILTVQALPEPPRHQAIAQVGRMVAPGGTLLVVAAAREESDSVEPPPWPLTRREIDAFATDALSPARIEHIPHPDRPTAHRWRAEFHREAGPA